MAYAEKGFAVVPLHSLTGGRCTCGKTGCNKPGKHPVFPWKSLQGKRPSLEQIIRWWEHWPFANVGIITGAISGIVVLDQEGIPEAAESLKGRHLSPTPTVITGGDGAHRYFKHPGFPVRNTVRILRGIDIRGDGGLVVAPPSPHVSGRRYTWAPGLGLEDVDFAPCPDWLLALLKDGGAVGTGCATDWRVVAAAEIPEGQRNDTIARFAGHLLRRGVDPYVVLDLLLAWNRIHCKPPLSDREVATTVDSICKAELRRLSADGQYP